MRVIVFCLGLWFASTASANSLENALCGTASVPVAQMLTSEKLCRSFALGLAEAPNATLGEAQALLTPENLATMASLTSIWLASQGVPVVGEAVDATLAALGIILLASQSADLTRELWDYAKLTTTAHSREELKAASQHLARAIALVGVNIVTFILTTKVSSRAKRQPSHDNPATQSGTLVTESTARAGGPGGHPDAVAANRTRAPSAAPVSVAEVKAAPSASKVFAVNAIVKRIDPAAFKRWLGEAPRREVSGTGPAKKFQRNVAGNEEILVKGGDKQVWADGARLEDSHLVEVKHVDKPDTSPFIDGSKCNEAVRASIRQTQFEEFEKYAAILKDPATPAVGLEVIVNDARAAPFFESLMRQFGIPGRIRIVPEQAFP